MPSWAWAALIMSAFLALSALAMWLVRVPLERPRGEPKPSDEPRPERNPD